MVLIDQGSILQITNSPLSMCSLSSCPDPLSLAICQDSRLPSPRTNVRAAPSAHRSKLTQVRSMRIEWKTQTYPCRLRAAGHMCSLREQLCEQRLTPIQLYAVVTASSAHLLSFCLRPATSDQDWLLPLTPRHSMTLGCREQWNRTVDGLRARRLHAQVT